MISKLSQKGRRLLPPLSRPDFARDVEIPAEVIHNSTDIEDYFAVFDFEQFVEWSRTGLFARPKLKLRADRSDFDRRAFARTFRASCAKEFDAARAQLERAGKAVLGEVRLPAWLRRKSTKEALETSIAETQTKVDAALQRVRIRLHMDLYRHAWREQRRGRLTGMDYDAWRLPSAVTQYLDIGESA